MTPEGPGGINFMDSNNVLDLFKFNAGQDITKQLNLYNLNLWVTVTALLYM